jgi:hypothetical protein
LAASGQRRCACGLAWGDTRAWGWAMKVCVGGGGCGGVVPYHHRAILAARAQGPFLQVGALQHRLPLPTLPPRAVASVQALVKVGGGRDHLGRGEGGEGGEGGVGWTATGRSHGATHRLENSARMCG